MHDTKSSLLFLTFRRVATNKTLGGKTKRRVSLLILFYRLMATRLLIFITPTKQVKKEREKK